MQQFQATYDQTVANYRQTVLTAFQQVEDNLAALRILAQVMEQQDAAVAAARRSLNESEVRYKAGVDPYLNVITAQTALLTAQQAAVTFREQQMVASVQLIKALGGLGHFRAAFLKGTGSQYSKVGWKRLLRRSTAVTSRASSRSPFQLPTGLIDRQVTTARIDFPRPISIAGGWRLREHRGEKQNRLVF